MSEWRCQECFAEWQGGYDENFFVCPECFGIRILQESGAIIDRKEEEADMYEEKYFD